MFDILRELCDPFVLTGLLLGALYFYFTANFDFWKVRDVPYRKPTLFFGNFSSLLLFRKSLPEMITDLYAWFPTERFFGVFRVRAPILVLRDPDLVKSVCVKDFSNFSNRGIPVNTSDPLSGHLFNLEGRKWKGLRSKLTPAFSPGKLKRMFYLLADCGEEFEKLIAKSCDGERSIEVLELAAKFIIDVIGSCAYSIQINGLIDEESEFHRAARKISRPGYKSTLWRMLRTAMPRLFKFLGIQVIDPEVTRFFKDLVSQIIKQREKAGVKRHDFMDLLIELKNKGTLDNEGGSAQICSEEDALAAKEIELDENAIAAQAFVFFAAGFDTSSNTISFCLHELALNTEIQERTREEIRSVLETYDGKLTYDAVMEMKYLDMVVLETLRKYPSAAFMSRKCEHTYQIPGSKVELPAGTRVLIPIYAFHHDPNYYPDPELFEPERFTDENKRARHPCVYLPFGEGPRNCIGMRFALLQIKVGIISFLKNHRVDTCEKSAVPMTFSKRSMVTTSEKGFWLKVTSLT